METSAYYEFRDLEDRHWWFRGRRAIFRKLLETYVGRGDKHSRRALDLGCGMGGMLGDVADFGRVYGTDISQECLAFCRNRGFTRIFKGVGPALPFPDSSLDLVCAFDTLEHIPQERETIAECFRILKPGGHFVLSVPAYQFLYTHQDRIVHHQRRYTIGDLARKLTKSGFRVQRASYINFILFPLILPVVLLVKLKQMIIPVKDLDRTNVGVPVVPWINQLFTNIFSFERHFLSGCTAPAGHSLIVVGRKP